MLSAGGVRLVDSGCLQMAGGEMRGCFRVGRSCRLFLKLQASEATNEDVVGMGLFIAAVDKGISATSP